MKLSKIARMLSPSQSSHTHLSSASAYQSSSLLLLVSVLSRKRNHSKNNTTIRTAFRTFSKTTQASAATSSSLSNSSNSNNSHERRRLGQKQKQRREHNSCCSTSDSNRKPLIEREYSNSKNRNNNSESTVFQRSSKEELLRWKSWASKKILDNFRSTSTTTTTSVSSSKDEKNYDPLDASSLHTELEWLIEDVLVNNDTNDSNNNNNNEVKMRMDFNALTALWEKRIDDRYPIQYLTNSSQFRTLLLYVAPGVLIPRPETELLIDFAEQHLKIYGKKLHLKDKPWLDLGTGSGCLALALAKELELSKVYASDFSEEALDIARINIERLKVEDKVTLLQGSWFDALTDNKNVFLTSATSGKEEEEEEENKNNIKFAGIVSNPPYIPSDICANKLQPEVGRYEPMSALDGKGDNGMGDLDIICKSLHKFLLPGGFLALETHGGEQALRVWETLWNTNLYEDVRVRSDFSGVDRFVTARLIDTKKVDSYKNSISH